MHSKYLYVSLSAAVLLAILGCSTTTNYPHGHININHKIGVFTQLDNENVAGQFFNKLSLEGNKSHYQNIQNSLLSLDVHKLVLRSVLQFFPPRTNALVSPVLNHQAVFSDVNNSQFDAISTGKKLSLDYVLILNVKSQLVTTGTHYQEKWRPEIIVNVQMLRVNDGVQTVQDSIKLQGKPFLKFLAPPEETEWLNRSYGSLALSAAKTFAENVGPVIRSVPQSEKMIHEKIYAFGHIRAMANKNNCVISGDLKKETTDTNVLYHVPCRDITLTYACDSESDDSRCWLQ